MKTILVFIPILFSLLISIPLSKLQAKENQCECKKYGIYSPRPDMGLTLKDIYYQPQQPGGFTLLKSFDLKGNGEEISFSMCNIVKYELQKLSLCQEDGVGVNLDNKELYSKAIAPKIAPDGKENCACLQMPDSNQITLVHSFTLSGAALKEFPFSPSIEGNKEESLRLCEELKGRLKSFGVCEILP